VWLDDCDPSCAEGTFSPYAVKVLVSRPRQGHFTRLTLKFSYEGKRVRDTRGVRYFAGGDGYRGYWSYYIVSTNGW
jgi:hypothetical protein